MGPQKLVANSFVAKVDTDKNGHVSHKEIANYLKKKNAALLAKYPDPLSYLTMNPDPEISKNLLRGNGQNRIIAFVRAKRLGKLSPDVRKIPTISELIEILEVPQH